MDRNQLIETTIFIIKLAVTKKLTKKPNLNQSKPNLKSTPPDFNLQQRR